MKLIVGTPLPPRPHRRSVKGFGAKRPAVAQPRASVTGGRDICGFGGDPCENSNDSGLGFDHHLDYPLPTRSALKVGDQETSWSNDHSESKRKKLDIKLEPDDARDNFGFETMSRGRKDMHIPGSLLASAAGETGRGVSAASHPSTGGIPRTPQRPPPSRPLALTSSRNSGPVSLSTQLTNVSHDGRTHLQIICQPEQQHRARYQTEGSRGAVKDRSGNGFPIVKLVGYNKPTVMQVFIGTDVGRVAPHMFYQACRVSGKNSTPCVEKKIDGTIVIEVDFDPAKEMVITCDCVGILKERNVDVEHRFPDQSGTRNKKKSTRCRMIFRTTITHDDGSTEILQTASQPIVCTQPPGVPEICKKSMSTCPCTGGMELFILGKNFLKDSRVLFQHNDTEPNWEESVQPDKEYLQQSHLVCTVPPYRRVDISDPVTVKLLVMSSGKMSEPHTFTYLPTTNPVVAAALQAPAAGATHLGPSCVPVAHPAVPASMELSRAYGKPSLTSSSAMRLSGQHLKSGTDFSNLKSQFMTFGTSRGSAEKDVHSIMMWQSSSGGIGKEEKKATNQSAAGGVKMMPLPPLLPLVPRRTPGVELIIPEMLVPELKTEVLDESSQNSPNQLSPEDLKGIDLRTKPVTTVNQLGSAADLSGTPSPSLTTFQRFVSRETYLPLPSQTGQSVEKYLSHLEGSPNNLKDTNQPISAYKMVDSNSINTSSQGLGGEKSRTQFNSQPLLFETTQQQNLLSSRHVIQQQSTQKIGFAGDIALPSLYERQESPEKTGNQHKSPIRDARDEVIVQAQSMEDSVSQSQSLQEALTQTQTLQEAFSQSQTLQEAFNQSQTLQKTFTQAQTLQEAITQSQSLQEAMVQTQSMPEAITQSHSPQQQPLQQAVIAPQTLQEVVAQSQSIQQAITGAQPLQGTVTHSQTIQEAIAQNQLIALSNLTSPPISNLCNQQATSRSQLSEVQESQVNANRAAENFHSSALQRTASETPLNLPEMINALPESQVMMQTPTTLVFRSPQESITRDTVCMDSKSDDQMMDSMNNNLQSGPLSTGSHTTVSGHSSPVLNSQLPAGSGRLNIEAPPPPTTRGLSNQEQSSLMSSAGLEALVSSAMDSHITSATEKLDAIVNSAADSHMANQTTNVTGVSDILNSRAPVGLGNQETRGDSQQSSVLANNLSLGPSINSVRDLNAFNLSSLQTRQQPVQLTQESIILNNVVSAAIDEHLRRQDAAQKEASVSDGCALMGTPLPSTCSGLSIVTPSTTDSILLKSPHISPIAVKNIILDTPVSVAVDGPVLVTNANCSSPVAVKHIKLSTQPSEPGVCLSTSVTSPTVTESNIHVQVPNHSSTIAVKDIINSHARTIDNSDTVVSAAVSLTESNSRIDILETGSCLPTGTAVEMHGHSLSSLLNSSNNSTLVTDSSQIQDQSIIITQSSPIPSESLQTQGCLPNSVTQSQDVQGQNELRNSSHGQMRTTASDTAESVMVQHTSLLNSMYAAASDAANVNFSTESTLLGTNSVDGSPVTVAQIASLNSLVHSTAKISQNPTLHTDNLIPAKTVEGTDANKSSGTYLIIGLSANEKNHLQTSGGQAPTGEYSVSDHKVCSSEVFNTETKPEERSNLNNFSRAVGSLESTEATNQQHKVPAIPSLPVPVADISSAPTQAKGLATSTTAPKKCEEGMVPQELTQMSESDLISYINPSCFDQV